MADATNILTYPELAIELLKLEFEWWLQKREEALFGLLKKMGLTENPGEGGRTDAHT